jgi:phage terminase large subunit-like protein
LDLEDTLEAYLLELARSFRVVEVRFDPYQFVRSAQTLEKQGVRMVPYNQTSGNLTQAGQTLSDLVNTRQLEFYADEELRRHFLNAVAVYSSRGWRLAKEKTSNKIDACVATSFAVLGGNSRGGGRHGDRDSQRRGWRVVRGAASRGGRRRTSCRRPVRVREGRWRDHQPL